MHRLIRLMAILLLILIPPQFSGPAGAETAALSTCPQAFDLTGIVTADGGAYLHYGSPDSRETELLRKGTDFIVLGQENSWYRALYGGRSGYIARGKVSLNGRAAEEPLPEALCAALRLADVIPLQKNKGRVTFEGSLTGTLPLEDVRLFLWDERAVAVEKAFLIPLGGETDVDLHALNRLLNAEEMRPGRKTIMIQGHSDGADFVLARLFFCLRGKADEPRHITGRCGIPSDRAKDNDVESAWQPTSNRPGLTVTLPDDGTARLMTLEWLRLPGAFTVTIHGSDGNLLSETQFETGFLLDSIQLPENAAGVTITPASMNAALSTVRVYPEAYAQYAVQDWEPTAEKTDLMLFSAHQDDEFLFFGGMIPYYNSKGKTVTVVYMTNCGRGRYREALNGLWTAGLRQYPIFVGWRDTSVESLDVALNCWKGDTEDPLLDLVRLIRRQRPEVIVTHDFNGEYGHVQHKLTAKLIAEAAALAADPAYDTETAAWTAKKVYIHLYGDSPTRMDWSRPLEEGGVITPLFLAEEGFDRHRSQQGIFTVERYNEGLYDSRAFGLYDSAVGEDTLKNDLFENIP